METISNASTDFGPENLPPSAMRLAKHGYVGVLTFDDSLSKMNTLSKRSAEDFRRVFKQAVDDEDVRAIVLISGKKDQFFVGADIKMLRQARSAAELSNLSRMMQHDLNQLAESPKPVVAAIHGTCLGGGLEVALACHWRIGTDHPRSVFGLPEVMLGLLPGGGGTQRLPRLVGLTDALDLLLSGKRLSATRAHKLGILDTLVPQAGLLESAISVAQRLADGKMQRPPAHIDWKSAALENNPAGRALLFRKAREEVERKSAGHYPAPDAILEAVETGVREGMSRGLEIEAQKFGYLSQTPQARALMKLFFAQNGLRKNRGGSPRDPAQRVGIVGAGLMGSGIASISVQKNKHVVLHDLDWNSLSRARKIVFGDLNKRVKRGSISAFDRDAQMARLFSSVDIKSLAKCDIVIEAVFENLQLKHQVIRELEEILPEHAILASNTSALPISELAKISRRPEQLVGMHYFSPVPKMPLLEIVKTEQTSNRALSIATELGIEQGKTIIVVQDSPGFFTTRVLAPYLDEAAILALEGMDFHSIDEALRSFGFPVGPMTLMDEVGVDVGVHVAHDLAALFAPRFANNSAVRAGTDALEDMVKHGFLGRKAGRGFYQYGDASKSSKSKLSLFQNARKAISSWSPFASKQHRPINEHVRKIFSAHAGTLEPRGHPRDEARDRLVLRFVNECALCLQEGVISQPSDGDIGAVFGLGFPPFLGGPFSYVDQRGAGDIVRTMERFADSYGSRFQPCDLLVQYAKTSRRFFGAT